MISGPRGGKVGRMDSMIPQWAYVLAAGAMFALAQQLVAREIARFEKRLDAVESGLVKENTDMVARHHKHADTLQAVVTRLAVLEITHDRKG